MSNPPARTPPPTSSFAIRPARHGGAGRADAHGLLTDRARIACAADERAAPAGEPERSEVLPKLAVRAGTSGGVQPRAGQRMIAGRPSAVSPAVASSW
jgi:hypothetical protein